MTSPTSPASLKDLWSCSRDYQAQCQPAEEVTTIVRLLELENASALADVGCGNGAFAIAAARAAPQLKVFGFDALASALDACRARAPDLIPDRLDLRLADAERLPLYDRS